MWDEHDKNRAEISIMAELSFKQIARLFKNAEDFIYIKVRKGVSLIDDVKNLQIEVGVDFSHCGVPFWEPLIVEIPARTNQSKGILYWEIYCSALSELWAGIFSEKKFQLISRVHFFQKPQLTLFGESILIFWPFLSLTPNMST